MTKYSFRKMLRLAADGIFGFTDLPFRVALFAGVTGTAFGAVYAVWVLHETLVKHASLPGWTSLLVTVIFFGSMNLFVLGNLGEHQERIQEQAKGRPIYVLDHRRVSREYGDLSDAERYLACAIRRAVPSLKPESHVLLTGMGVYPIPMQPLDSDWTVTGLLQLLYHDASLRGTALVELALSDDAIGLLASSPPKGAEVQQALNNPVVLQYGRAGFRPGPMLPPSLVGRGLPEEAGWSDRIGSSPRPSAFMDEYLCGCREGAARPQPVAAGTPQLGLPAIRRDPWTMERSPTTRRQSGARSCR